MGTIILSHLLTEVETFLGEGDNDLELNEVELRFGELSDGYRSLLAMMGHLFRCSLKAQDWDKNPVEVDGMALIDEIDLHLHPAWQYHVVGDFLRAFPNLQLITSTHSPLVVGALKRENVHVMRLEEDGGITLDHPEIDPQGLGVAGTLTSAFDLSSTIDQPTLDKINRRLLLHSRRGQLSEQEEREYQQLTNELAVLGFNREFSDPYFERFAVAMAKRHEVALGKLTPEERRELDEYANRLVGDIMKGDDE